MFKFLFGMFDIIGECAACKAVHADYFRFTRSQKSSLMWAQSSTLLNNVLLLHKQGIENESRSAITFTINSTLLLFRHNYTDSLLQKVLSSNCVLVLI